MKRQQHAAQMQRPPATGGVSTADQKLEVLWPITVTFQSMGCGESKPEEEPESVQPGQLVLEEVF